MQWRARVRKSLCPEKLVGRVSLFLRTLVETAASLRQGHTGLAWKEWGQRLGHIFLHMPSSGDCRVPPALDAGDLRHPDRSSHLPGVSYILQCLLSLNPCPQPSKCGTAQAQIRFPRCAPLSSQLFGILERLACPVGGMAALGRFI